MDDPVRLSLLGPLEVRVDDRSVPVAGVKLQSLVTLLALNAPHVVSDDLLLDRLWGDDQPANPANALQALVSHLRRLLGRDAVARQGLGYALRIAPDLVDAVRLERLVREAAAAADDGDQSTAGDRYGEALRLVRGPPLGDLADSWVAREATTRLEHLVLAAHEGLVASELALGHHAEVLPDLVDLVARHPTAERFRAQLIVALYRSGRQADALQAYRDAREHLREELGLDPGPELQALERSVLAHDPALAAPIALVPTVPAGSSVPTPLTSFLGRHDELAALATAIGEARLTSVVGPGGVGKTRLVLALAGRLAEEREVWFIELAPVTSAAEVGAAVAAGLGAPERAGVAGQPAPTPEQRAVERLGGRDAILVLDSCEHVAAGAASCALTLLSACPNLRVVTTSRAPLGVEGERHVVLGPLDDDTSAALFVERARLVQPLFPEDGAHQDELRQLCRHLDGLPLAIELAAARAKTLPVPEIAGRLQDRFALLRRTQRSGPARHEGLEAAIDWSYDLLFEDERRTFCRLAVCSGGATIEAAERLCGDDAYETASRLVDRSMLVADISGRAVRFTMLESLRAYGLDRLEEGGGLPAARSDHLAWAIDLARRAAVGIRAGVGQLEWLALLDDEHDNLLAALDHAVEHDPESALALLGPLIMPWWFRGRRREIRSWARASLAAGADQPPALRVEVLGSWGLVAEPIPIEAPVAGFEGEAADELGLAELHQRQALAAARAGDDAEVVASLQLLLLNTLARRAGAGEPVDADEVATLVATSIATFGPLGSDFEASLVHVTDAVHAVIAGDLEHAAASVAAGRPLALRTGDRFASSRLDYVQGMLDDLAGDPVAAYRHIERSLRVADELGLREAVTSQARLLGPLADRCGQPELAAQWRAFLGDRGSGWTHYDGTAMAAAQNREGLAAGAAGDVERAEAAHRRALEWYAAAGLPDGAAFAESCLGFLAVGRGDRSGAADHHRAALAAATTAADGPALALALEGCAGSATDHRRAALLLGGAHALRDHEESPGAPTHRDQVAAIADEARARLGVDAFDRATAEGAALDRRALVALARETG